MKKYIIFFVLLSCTIAVVSAFFIYRKQYFCRRLNCLAMDSLKEFSVKDIYQEDNTAYRALYIDGETMLRTEVVSKISLVDAIKYINAGIARMKGLFIDSPAPYPGVISDKITCDSKYKPSFSKLITKNNIEIQYFTGYLNNRLVFGSCIDNQAVYKGILAFFYCPGNQQAYQLEIISTVTKFDSSITEYQGMVESIGCK